LKNLIRNKNFYYVIFCDAVIVAAAYLLSYLLRFEGTPPPEQWVVFKRTLPFIVPFKIFCFFLFNLYRGMWRFTSLEDLYNVFKAVSLASICIVLTILYLSSFQGYPRSVFVIDWVLTLLFVCGSRVAVRVALTHNLSAFWTFRRKKLDERKLLIIGAGVTGERVLREILDNPDLKLYPIGFLDDDLNKQGKTIHGVPVLGTVEKTIELEVEFEEILIAIPSLKSDQMRRIVSACEQTGKRYRTIPAMGELIDGKVSIKKMRDVRFEDLLGREEVRLDVEAIHRSLHNKRILVTGAGGSIGSELVRQICRFHPKCLALLEFNEFNLFRIEMECSQRFMAVPVKSYLSDIRDKGSVEKVFADFKPEVVFHAAAYKHVPLQELNPRETVYNNVVGTRNLAEAAKCFGAERFVLVSTDKAVRPTNIMGATKRIAEMYLECMNGDTKTLFMAVRFGNVLGSSGSVLPIFQQQIAQGHPVTVTHPNVTRYFMSIPEAAQLILQAGAMGKGREIFILDMGKPMKILDVARDLIRLHGLEPDRDVPIRFIGLRPGEKLYEELITEGEGIVATTHEKIRVIRGNHYDARALGGLIDELIAAADTYNRSAIKQKLKEIVPEYNPQ
jgi:FlaA1/EpsC-like NDP-sugar epimerase